MTTGTVTRPDGARIFYETSGDGPPLLLIAGLAAGRGIWRRQLAAWNRHHTVIRLDNRGVGASTGPAAGRGRIPWITLMAGDVAAVLDDLDIGSAALCGLSMGGFVAQTIAVRHPERVTSLVLTSTAPCHPRPRPGLSLDGTLLAAQYAGRGRSAVVEWLRDDTAARPTAVALQVLACLAHDLRRELPRLRLPVLVVHGSADRVIPVRYGRWLAEHIPGARLVVYEGAGHAATLERAEEYGQEVLGFLAR